MDKCYCCHKIKPGTVIIIDLKIRGIGENKVTETEARFVCNDCNHLKGEWYYLLIDKNNYCEGCPFIDNKLKKYPIYDEKLQRDKEGNIIRLKICIEENKIKFGG